jgi:glycosyltransferase involved in cell wall biosynthesis
MNRRAHNRILMLLENVSFPQDIRVRREAYALATAGYQVTVICPRAPGQSIRQSVNGVRVYRYPAPPPADGFLGYVFEYGYAMFASVVLSLLVFLGGGFDVIHAHNPPDTFVFIAILYRLFGKPFVYDHHDLSPEMYRARFPDGANRVMYRILVSLEKLTCRWANHVIVTNQSYKRIAMDRGRVPEHRITVVRNGPERSYLSAPGEPDPELRQMGKRIIGYVGLMGHQDGVDYLLRALHHLLHDLGRVDFYSILIGGGDNWIRLKALAQRLGLDNYVRFPGFVYGDNLRRYLLAADICVDATPSNAYSDRSTMFKLMEYMSLGKPSVVFDLPEHRVTAQQAAVYVTPNDELGFAKALAQLMDDPQHRETLGAFGKRRIETQLAWEYSASHLLDVYRQILPLAPKTNSVAAQVNGVLGEASSQIRPPA